jgi:mono/diheme cytochrome c family protein
MRRALFSLCAIGVVACTEPFPADDLGSGNDIALGQRYERDAAFRREALLASLVNLDNGYSRKRLALYDEAHWGALAEWNPSVMPVTTTETAPPDGSAMSWNSLSIDDVAWDEDALIRLGRAAFFRYPLQMIPSLAQAMGSADRGASYGLWVHEGALGATVWAQVPSGAPRPAVTCATCHASLLDGELIAGRNNPDLDLQRLAFDAQQGTRSDPSTGLPGRVDVTDDALDNPTAIADLRPARWQLNLHRAATLKNGLVALAVRIETLIITSLDETVRPPRKLAFALALYLFRLQAQPMRTADESSRRGEALFRVQCAGCHASAGFSGEPVPLELVGTDATVGSSPDRFTGFYRVPSLRGVGDRKRLLAGGQVVDLAEMLNPARSALGHRFGLTLSDVERVALLAYLRTL